MTKLSSTLRAGQLLFLASLFLGFLAPRSAHAWFYLSAGGGMSQGAGTLYEGLGKNPMLITADFLFDFKAFEIGVTGDYSMLKSDLVDESGNLISASAFYRLFWGKALTTPFVDVRLGASRGNLRPLNMGTYYFGGGGLGVKFNLVPNLMHFKIRGGVRMHTRAGDLTFKNSFYLLDGSASIAFSL